jgi:hypothetical protein
MMSLSGIRLNRLTDYVKGERDGVKGIHGGHRVLEEFLDLSPITKQGGGVFNFYGTIVFGYDYTKKNGFSLFF